MLAGGVATGDTLTLNADNEWKGSFTKLDKFAEGAEIVYTVEEDAVASYESNIVGTVSDGFTITNIHVPEKVNIPVDKVWEDVDNKDGKRPTGITVKLLAGGNDTGKTLVLNADNEWKGSFTNLDKFAEGEEIVYSVEELEVTGYTSTITGTVAEGFTITNSYTPEDTTIEVTKLWEDADNKDGIRPDSIQVQLLVGGKEVEGKVITLYAANDWIGSFTGLAKFNDGEEIIYSVKEVQVPAGYEVSYGEVVNGAVSITNTHVPEETTTTSTPEETSSDTVTTSETTTSSETVTKTGESSNSIILGSIAIVLSFIAAAFVFSKKRHEEF